MMRNMVGQILKGTTFTKYQQFIKNCFKILPRQALHAKSLAFDHPVTGKRLSFDSELPDDMEQVIEKWRKYISGRDTDKFRLTRIAQSTTEFTEIY